MGVFNKRHHKVVAKVFKENDIPKEAAEVMLELFVQDNDVFDAERFWEACGREVEFRLWEDGYSNLTIRKFPGEEDILLQGDDRQLVYGILRDWEIENLNRGYEMSISTKETRVSTLEEIWAVDEKWYIL